uniref:Fibronectin type-III domain-containing protein n=1 Tax=viral metagenome TaxID=1070528 RepID=A0A6C0B3T4_9ZZZZ
MSSNTWRQYGGTRKQNQFHNLTIGTLVADQVLLRESYAGKFKIPGSIFVGADVNAIGNVYAFGSSLTTFDTYTGKNLFVKKNLYFGTDASLADLELLNHAYMAGNFANKTIGINTQNPVSSFDINGANSSQTQILSVSSLSTQVRCVLGQNVNKSGIALSATENNAVFAFYVDTDLSFSSNPDSLIEYVRGGNMNYRAANNNITSSINTNITSTASTYLTAQTLTNITSGQNVTINTKNTNILSRLYISNRGQPTNVYNESTVIYDISNGLYLNDAYENDNARAGSALTLVGTDSSSNTFLRLVTTNNAGLSIAAGIYPNDQTRTISTLGLTDYTGKYRVNQTVVSGNSAIKYYTTTGFNTYAPRIDNYVMDINGPTHISNGEINQMAKFDYEILKTSFSKTVKNFGISVGTPSPKIPTDLSRNPQFISYTSDSGVTWIPVRVDSTGDFEQGQQKDFTVYTHNNEYAFLGSSTSVLYYTKDGGKNWVNAAANDPGNDDYRRTYKTLFLNPTIIDGKNRLFASVIREKGSIISPSISELCIFYADLNLNALPTLPSQIQGGGSIYFFPNTNFNNTDNFAETVVNIAMKTINASDGTNNSIYFVGTGINKFNTTTVSSQYLINTGNTYFGVHCYSDTYVVAVGAIVTIANEVTATIISYTKNGTNWFNSTLPSGLGLVRLRSVHLFDENNGMAVGDNGTFLYTKDGSVTWSVVPDSILNSSGYAARINGSYNKLRDIYMIDTNRMMVTSVKQSYVLSTSTPGLSKVYTCYLPNLYNSATNNIFDVSGNMTVSGNIDINDGGNLNTNCPAFNLINEKAKTVNFAGNATLINIGNNLPSQTNIKTNIDVVGNAIFRSTVDIQSDLALGGNLRVNGTGNSSFNGRLFVAKGLEVAQKAVFNNGIHVFGNIEHELDFRYLNRLYVEQDTYLYQRVFIGGDASLNGNVYIGGPLSIPATITPNSNIITLTGTVPIHDSGSLEPGTSVSYYDSVRGWVIPVGTTILSINQIQTFSYNPDTQLNDIPGDILNGNIVTLSANVGTTLSSSILVNVIFQNSKIFSVFPDTSLNSRLCVGGDVSLNGRSSIINDVSLGGNLNIGDNTGVYANISTKGITYQATIANSGTVNTSQYNFLPYSQFQHIQTLSEDVQKRLVDLTSRTQSIGIANTNTQTVPTNLQLIERTTSYITISFTPVLNAYSYKAYINGVFANGLNGRPYAVGSANSFTIFGLNTLTSYTITISSLNTITGAESSQSTGLNTATREFDIDDTENRNFEIDTTTIDPSTFGVTTIDPTTLGLLDIDFSSFSENVMTQSNIRDVITSLLTFDLAGNNLLVSGNLEPGSPSNLTIGASDYPFATVYLNNQNAINFMSQSLTNQGTMTFNLSTGYLDLSCNGLLGSTLLTYGGNVAIGKPLPTTNFDVLGQSIFNGNITQQTGNLYLTNRLFIQSDISLVGNMFSGKNLYQTGDAFLNSRVFVLGDISLNSNLFVSRDTSLNQRLYVGNDTSLNKNLFVGQNTTINGNTLLNNQLTVQGVTILNNDVSLNSNIYINRKATINNDLSLNGNFIVNGFSFLNSDEYLQGNLFVTGNQFLSGNILINGFSTNIRDVTMSSRLYVGGDVSINNRLFLKGLANFNSDVLMNGNAFIKNDLSLNGNLSIGGTKLIVSGDTSLNGELFINNSLYVNRDSSFNGKVFVNNTAFYNSDVTMNNRLFLAKDASFSSNVYINDKLITNNDISINANIINSGKIITAGDISTNSRLFVSGITTLNSSLTVEGSTLLKNDLSINANISSNNSITAANSFVKGNIILNGDASFNSNLIVAKTAFIGGDTNMNGNLRVNNITNTGSITTNGNNLTFGDATIGSNLFVNRNATLNGSLAIGGDANVNGSVIVNNDVSLNGRIFVGSYPIGSIPIGAIAGGAGLALGSFAGDVNIGKNFYVGAETVLYGNLTIVKNLTLLGQLVIKQYTVNQTVTTLSYEIMIAQDLSLSGRLHMTGDASINGRLYVGQDVSINANLFVKGRTTFAQPITIGNTITINGSVIENGTVTTNAQVTNNALNIFNADASLNSRFYVGGSSNFISDVSINNRLYVQNDSSLNGNFYANGLSILNSDVSINNRLYVQNDSSLNGNFYANGLSILNSDVSINNRLYVQNDVSMSSNLYVNKRTILNGDVSTNNRLYVQNDVSLNSNLYVARQTTLNGDVSINTRLYVENDVSMGSNLYVARRTTLNGDVSMNTRLYVRNDASFGSNLYINALSTFNGDVSMNNRLFVASDASVNGNFYVGGKTIFQRELSCNKVICGVDASFTGNIAIYGNLYLQTDLRFDSMYVKKNLSVIESVFITGQMTQMVDASLNGNLNVMRDASLNGRLAVAQDVSFNSNINVIKDSSLNSRLFVGQDTSLNANLYVGNNTYIKGNLINNGDVSMVASLDLNGPMISRNNMNIYGIINQYSTNPTSPNTIVNNTSYVTSNALQVTLGTTASQNVYVPGNIGIGTTNPLVPLYINKSSTSTGQDAGYYISNSSSTTTAINTSAAYIYSIYALNSIATSDKLIATSSVYFSDERIKTNIQDIDCSNALENIRQLKPKQYNYIDSIGQGSEPTLGFIAQEVKPIIKYSVSISKNFIPNIYELCKIENQVITLLNKTTHDLFVGSKIKAISRSGSEIILTVSKINDEKTFMVNDYDDVDFSIDDKIFIYGQEIEDFNNLDKNAIFTITTAALKQVDADLQDTKKIVEQQKIQIETLESQIKFINAKLEIF